MKDKLISAKKLIDALDLSSEGMLYQIIKELPDESEALKEGVNGDNELHQDN